MPRLGDEVTVIEASQEGMVLLGQLVFKDTEELGRQEPLFDAIVVIQGCLGAQQKWSVEKACVLAHSKYVFISGQ